MRRLAILLACGSLLSWLSACYVGNCDAKPLPLKGNDYSAPPGRFAQEPDGIEQALMDIGQDEVTVEYTRSGKRWRATYAIRERRKGTD